MLEEYGISVLKLAVFFAIALNFAHPRQNKTIKLSVGIVMICAIMLPFIDIINEKTLKIGDFDLVDREEAQGEGLIKGFFEDAVKEYISQTCGIDKSDVSVSVGGFDIATMKAKSLRVTLSGKCMTVDYRRLEVELAKEFTEEGRCEVEIGIV